MKNVEEIIKKPNQILIQFYLANLVKLQEKLYILLFPHRKTKKLKKSRKNIDKV